MTFRRAISFAWILGVQLVLGDADGLLLIQMKARALTTPQQAEDAALVRVELYKEGGMAKAAVKDNLSSGSSKPHQPPPSKKEIGCYARQDKDKIEGYTFFDKMCQTWTDDEACRSGLPFYRLRLQQGQSSADCFAFCLSKGLDLSGTAMPEHECRCGASASMTSLWHGAGSRVVDNLKLPAQNASEAGAKCRIVVWKYDGAYEDGGVPLKFAMALSEDDTEYLTSILLGSDVGDSDPEDVDTVTQEVTLPTQSGSDGSEGDDAYDDDPEEVEEEEQLLRVARAKQARKAKLNKSADVPERCFDKSPDNCGLSVGGSPLSCATAKNGPYGNLCSHGAYGAAVKAYCGATCGVCTPNDGEYASCYPENCAAGGGPWPKSSEGIVRIPFYFDDSGIIPVDDTRKSTFRDAVAGWKLKSCIFLEETDDMTVKPSIAVKVLDEAACFYNGPLGPGFPGDDAVGVVNLGWCHAADHVGNMMHQIGHAIGMNHEQKRMDATEIVDGNGPFLTMHWENIKESSVAQWKPDPKSYVGSSNKGGYVGYDYGSIMQYSPGQGAHTWPAYDIADPAFQGTAGQRSQISQGDVNQISDMYQCSAPPAWPDKSPTKYRTSSGQLECEELLEGSYANSCNDWETVVQCATSCEYEHVCEDSTKTGFFDGDTPLSCDDLAEKCTDPVEGALVMRACPVTCELKWKSGYDLRGTSQTCEDMTHMCSHAATPLVAKNCPCTCYLNGGSLD